MVSNKHLGIKAAHHLACGKVLTYSHWHPPTAPHPRTPRCNLYFHQYRIFPNEDSANKKPAQWFHIQHSPLRHLLSRKRLRRPNLGFRPPNNLDHRRTRHVPDRSLHPVPTPSPTPRLPLHQNASSPLKRNLGRQHSQERRATLRHETLLEGRRRREFDEQFFERGLFEARC